MREVPVSGYLYHDHSGHGTHTHHIYMTHWDRQPVHTHHFQGVTSFDVGHNHRYVGTTEPAPSGVPHRHRYFTFTSIDNGHRHIIQGITGPAIPLPDGGHIHHFSGTTTVDGRIPHRHHYRGMTSR